MSCHGLGLIASNRYKVDLSNEVLNIHFGQGAAQISEIKVRGWKEIADSARLENDTLMAFDIFAAPWPKSINV